MGLFDKAISEITRANEKHGTESGGMRKASQRGGLNSGQWWQSLSPGSYGIGLLSKDAMQARIDTIPMSPGKQPLGTRGLDQVAKADISNLRNASFGANLGHQAIMPGEEKFEGPPAVGAAPGQGANTTSAKAEARARAVAAASRRRGVASTVATTPLGTTGQGAVLGRKQLLGE